MRQGYARLYLQEIIKKHREAVLIIFDHGMQFKSYFY